MKAHLAHLGFIGIVLLGVAASSLFFTDYQIYVVSIIAWLSIMAVSFDVLMGYTGYLSLAHGALFGVGAYTFGNLASHYGINLWLALLLAGFFTMVLGSLVAMLAFRTKGLYFAIVTLGIGVVGFQTFTIAVPLTGGLQGMAGIPSFPVPSFLALEQAQYLLFILLAALAITYVVCYAFTTSRIGRDCLAIREDSTLAQALGVKIGITRLFAFAISAFFVGIAGGLFASASNFVGPESFSVLSTGMQLVILTVVGGMGTLWGPVVGSVLLTTLSESLRMTQNLSLFIYGGLLLVFILFAPDGMAGLIKNAVARFTRLTRS